MSLRTLKNSSEVLARAAAVLKQARQQVASTRKLQDEFKRFRNDKDSTK